MLANLRAEMQKKQITQREIANFLNLDEKTISKKMNEKNDFTRSEMYAIRDKFFATEDMACLFASDRD